MVLITTEYLLNREVEHVLALLSPVNQLICQVCLHTGLRVSDVLSLRTEDIKPRVWIRESKTGKRRLIGLPAELREAILKQAGEKWAFPSPADPAEHRTRQGVWKAVKQAANALHLPQNVAPHSFRKCYAVDLMDQYGDIEKVRRALNHNDVTTTMIYAMAAQLLRSKAVKKIYRAGKR